jgi:eukaryotic-like serine/threonine-protein kinase
MSPRPRVGARIGAHHTVLGVVDKKPGRHPIYIVWDHRAWCPMACKVFRSAAEAEREAGILSALAHPNIVRLLGVGERMNLLLEFLEGPSLDRVMDGRPEGRLSVSDALRTAIHVGAGLEHVRDRGLLHLDLAPSNIIVTCGRPTLIDFGTARRQDEARPDRVTGTDPYIAPEECLLREVTPAADVFGLGVLLYELLTGELPFPEGTRRDPFPQTHASPTPARDRRPGLPRSLDDLVLACLAREPSARPTLTALLPRLHDFIRGGRRMWPADFRPARPKHYE